jgi:mannose-1-phosphate guanylyltransferase
MQDSNTWGIILAGGEGTRVRLFLQQLCGGQGLKQFSTVIGRRSMIQHTLDRVQRLIPPERILIVVASAHRAEAARHLGHWPKGNIIYQPINRNTAAGILLPLTHVSYRDPSAKAIIFPSDHFVLDEPTFMEYVKAASEEVERQPRKLILLGMTPTEAEESDYGYIEVERQNGKGLSLPVKAFWEKPPPHEVKRLITRGALWNTMVIAASTGTIWRYVNETAPLLLEKFALVHRMLEKRNGSYTLEQIYEAMPAVNFSSQICQASPQRLRVLSVPEVGWSDWGTTSSIIRSLIKINRYEEFRSRLIQRGVDVSLYPACPSEKSMRRPTGPNASHLAYVPRGKTSLMPSGV